MKINGITNSNSLNSQKQQNASEATKDIKEKTILPERSSVKISKSLEHLREMFSKTNPEDIIDYQKVQEIRSKIEEGKYTINPDSIAGKIMESEF